MLYAPSSSLFVTWRTSQSDSLPWLLRMGSDHQSEGIWTSAWRSCALLCLSALFVSLFGKCERFVRKAQNQLDVSIFFLVLCTERSSWWMDGTEKLFILRSISVSLQFFAWKFATSSSITPFRCPGWCDDCVGDVYLELRSPWKFSNILGAFDKR